MKVEVSKISVDKSMIENMSAEEIKKIFDPKNINKNCRVIAGKAAGICYMTDDYIENGYNDDEKSLKRANFNAKSGHYSVYEHAHISFIIECSKALAMVLNSTRLYTTSEKSARYTKMHPETDLEVELYNKWLNIFKDKIKAKFPDETDKSIEKLAMENARYLTSVFTPTTMEYTVPYSRAVLLIEWLYDLAYYIDKMKDATGETITYKYYYSRLADEAIDLAMLFIEAIGENPVESTLKDHKDIGVDFFNEVNNIRYKLAANKPITKEDFTTFNLDGKFFGDVYQTGYLASFAAIAQLERHRRCPVTIGFHHCIYNEEIRNSRSILFYAPKIIRDDNELLEDWYSDCLLLLDNGIIIQGLKMAVRESGDVDGFILKCKERLCARTQLEVCQIVSNVLIDYHFYTRNSSNTSNSNNRNFYIRNNLSAYKIESMIEEDNKYIATSKTRCQFPGYTCKEPCNRFKSNNARII